MKAKAWRITGGVATLLIVGGALTATQAQAGNPWRTWSRPEPRPGATAPATPTVTPAAQGAARFREDFATFDKNVWSCEYDCPTVSDGKATFALKPGVAPDNYGSWSKARYKPEKFTEAEVTVRFSLGGRPQRVVDDKKGVWWGVAFWDNGPKQDMSEFNEINFGYTTNQSYTNTQLRFESAKRGKDASLKVDTGMDLYDGRSHEATLAYDARSVRFYLDGRLLKTITDQSVIPTDPMSLILGPRLVTGSQPLRKAFTETIDWVEIK